jgi:F-type H+-transporting ATPase subunit delta
MYEYLDRRYALALYEVGEENGKVDEYMEDLREIVNLMKTDSDFLQIIKHPQISTSKKKQIFKNIFKDKMDEELLSFLLLLIDKDRILHLEEKLSEMEKIRLERNNTLIAKIKTVLPLNEEEKSTLIQKLQNKYDKKIILRDEIDKSILGGVYVRVGNDVIDGTVKTKLEEMKKLMLKRE